MDENIFLIDKKKSVGIKILFGLFNKSLLLFIAEHGKYRALIHRVISIKFVPQAIAWGAESNENEKEWSLIVVYSYYRLKRHK